MGEQFLGAVLQVAVNDVEVVERDVDLVEDLPEDRAVPIDLIRILVFDALEDFLDGVEDDGRLVGIDHRGLRLLLLLLGVGQLELGLTEKSAQGVLPLVGVVEEAD